MGKKTNGKLNIREMAVFSMLGALMYASKVAMEFLPNVHLLGVFICAETIVYGRKALWPIYIFIFITGLMNGFASWWIPYLYIWVILYFAVRLIPKGSSPVFYMLASGLHGLLYGTLYAPAQALLFGLNFQGMITWIIAGLPFDAIHGVSNFICGILIVPLSKLLMKLEKGEIKNE